MTSLLSPSYSLILGSQELVEQALSIRVSLDLAPVVDSLEVVLPPHVALSAQAGDDVKLKLNNGETEAEVFTGTIEAIHRRFDSIRVRALNGGGTLARFRPAITFEQVSAGDVATSLCGAAGVDTGEIADGVDLAFYAADPGRNAWEHIARVAEWSGAIARMTAENTLDMRVVNATNAEVALRYGRELLSLDQESRAAAIESFVVAGESGAGSTSAPEAVRPSTDFFGGSRPDGPSLASRWSSQPALRTTAAAASAGAALQRAYGASRMRGHFRAFLLPQLQPGAVVEIQDLPEGLATDVIWLRRVSHVIERRGASTRADFARGGDSFDPLTLLGSLAGAIGGAF